MKKIRKKRIYLSRLIEKLWNKMPTGKILQINKVRAHYLEFYGLEFNKEQVKKAMYSFARFRININDGRCRYLTIPFSPERTLLGLQKLLNDEAGKKAWENYRKQRIERKEKEWNTETEYLKVGVDKKFMTENKADDIIAETTLISNIKTLRKGYSNEPKERKKLSSTRLGDLVRPEEEKSEATPKEAL